MQDKCFLDNLFCKIVAVPGNIISGVVVATIMRSISVIFKLAFLIASTAMK